MTLEVRPGRPEDGPALRRVERLAGQAFRTLGMDDVADDEPPGLDTLASYAEAQLVEGQRGTDRAEARAGRGVLDPGPVGREVEAGGRHRHDALDGQARPQPGRQLFVDRRTHVAALRPGRGPARRRARRRAGPPARRTP